MRKYKSHKMINYKSLLIKIIKILKKKIMNYNKIKMKNNLITNNKIKFK